MQHGFNSWELNSPAEYNVFGLTVDKDYRGND